MRFPSATFAFPLRPLRSKALNRRVRKETAAEDAKKTRGGRVGYTGLFVAPNQREHGVQDGLAGILAHNPARGAGGGDSFCGGAADRLLDRLLALAVEVSDGSGGRLADRAAADGAGILCSGSAGITQSAGTLVAVADRAHVGVY